MKFKQCVKSIKSLEKQVLTSFIEIGKHLYLIQEKTLYKPKYASFSAFLAGEGFSFSTVHAYNFIKIYKWVLNRFNTSEARLTVQELGITKMLAILNQPEENREELIRKAQTCSVSQLKKTREKPEVLILVGDWLYRPYKQVKNEKMLEKIRQKHQIKTIS